MSRKNRSRRLELQHAVIPLVIAFSTFAAFLPTLQNQFVSWDDDKNFLENPDYRGLAWTNLRWMWTTHLGHYIPLTWMTLGLDYLLWGMNPLGYHLTNLLLHAAKGHRQLYRLQALPYVSSGWEFSLGTRSRSGMTRRDCGPTPLPWTPNLRSPRTIWVLCAPIK